MSERKGVVDWHGTLVNKQGLFFKRDQWIPGMPDVLSELRLMGVSFAVWTADIAERVEANNRILVPAMLGLAQGGFTDEYYAVNRLPPIPDNFELPYDRYDIYEYVHTIGPQSSHNPMIDESSQSVGGITYPNAEMYQREIQKCLLRHNMRHGSKIPTLIGSHVLIDDLVNSPYVESGRLRHEAHLFGFNLVDPKRMPFERTNHWIGRMVDTIMESLSD